MNRNISRAWAAVVQITERPHAGRFELMTQEAEFAFDQAAKRLELIDTCRKFLSPAPDTVACNYEVTPGGLSYQDAALQCLLGGAVESLETISKRAEWVSLVTQAFYRRLAWEAA